MNYVGEQPNIASDPIGKGPTRPEMAAGRTTRPIRHSSPMLDRVVIELTFHVPSPNPAPTDVEKYQERDQVHKILSALKYTVSKKGADYYKQTRRRHNQPYAIKLSVLPSRQSGTTVKARIECNPILNDRLSFSDTLTKTDYNGKKNFLSQAHGSSGDRKMAQTAWVQDLMSKLSKEILDTIPSIQRQFATIHTLELTTDIYDTSFSILKSRYKNLVRDTRSKSHGNISADLGTHKDCPLALYQKCDDLVRLELKLTSEHIKKHCSSLTPFFVTQDATGFEKVVDELIEHYYDDQLHSILEDISDEKIENDGHSETSVSENTQKWALLLQHLIPKDALEIARNYCTAGQVVFGEKLKHSRSRLNKVGLTINCGKGCYKFKSFDECKKIIHKNHDSEAEAESSRQSSQNIDRLILNVANLTFNERLDVVAYYLEKAARAVMQQRHQTQAS